MYLKSLEMQGFKSFPDKMVFSFGKGITAVVGPNGSGKSNIADGVKWVLGEQSTKSLRGAKMEDVVFSGTSLRRAVSFAEVTLRMDNTDRALDCDSDEVIVTRRYYRSGESEYKLNGAAVRLKDINELFMDTGLGRDGYSMVSQGKITDMISAKSSERRDMFEEAAGISHYRYRRTDALRRLSQAEENLVRLRDIATELESRVEPLREQSEKAAKFIEYNDEKRNLDIGISLHSIEKTKDNLSAHEQKLTVAEAQLKDAQDELAKLEQEIEEAIALSRSYTLELDEARHSSSQAEEKAVALDGLIAVVMNDILHNNESIERIEKEKSEEDFTNSHITEQTDEAKAEIANLTAQMDNKRKELLGVSDEQTRLMRESDVFSQELVRLTDEAARLTAELSDARVALSAAVSSMDETKSRLALITESEKSREPILAALTKERNEAQEALNKTLERLTELNNSLSGLTMRTEKRREKAQSVAKELAAIERELDSCEARAAMLSDLEKNMEGYQGSVKSVMREVKRGVLKGIHAPVSQLISVEEEYAVAIETALGAQLQNIVTDTENDAKRAINMLKEGNAGRATFLPLTAIRGKLLEEKGLSSCEGYVDIASRLVKSDSKYSEIIMSQLGRTVVATDMDRAVDIAKKYGYRFKIVTLDGQVINAGGSMTGGSRSQGAGMLSRAGEIERLTKKAQELRSKHNELTEQEKSAKESLSASEAELEGHKSELVSFGEEKLRLEGIFNLKDGQLTAVTASAEESEKEKAELNTKIKRLEGEAAVAEKSIEELTAQINDANEKSAALGGDRDKLSEQREEAVTKISDINLALVALQKEIEAFEETVARLSRRRSSHTDKITQLSEEIAEFEKKNEALNARAEELRAQTTAARSEGAGALEKIEELVKLRDDVEAKSGKLRLTERAKTSQREALSGEVVRLSERKTAMMKEYDDICAKLFEEYNLTRREAELLGIVIENISESKKRLNELKNKIKALGNVNLGAIEEYKEVSERFIFLSGQIEDIDKSKKELIKLIDELTVKMASRFRTSFDEINKSFAATFAELFDGGKASLELQDESDILECGIDIKVQPPGKNIQNIDLLSGGEKGLSAIALLFAILKVNPAPFCIYDEVEAALDDVNVVRYASYVRRMVAQTQFVLITHRRGTMEEADMLYGVTMQEEGVSKLLELKSAEMAKELGLV